MSRQKYAKLLQSYRRNTPFAREVGHRIGSARKRQGLTLHEAGAKLGISHAYLSEIEHGKRVAPLPLLERVAEWTPHEFDWLLFGDEETSDARGVAEADRAYRTPRAIRLPIVGRASAGPQSNVVWDPIDPPEWHELPANARLIEVKGDSMRPLVWPGQKVIAVEAGGDLSNGDLAVVELREGRQLFKRWWADRDRERVTLTSLRTDEPEPPLVVTARQVRRAWRIIGVLF